MSRRLKLTDFTEEDQNVLKEVLDGLTGSPKQLPSKLFYDEAGSALFDRITRLDEYYLTRTEAAIMRDHVDEMAALIGPDSMMIEYGSGSSEKSRILLDELANVAAYVPIDISREHLARAANRIAERYPDIEVLPVCADYSEDIEIPQSSRAIGRRVVYYPGSTIGNFHRAEAVRFLERIARIDGEEGGLLIGVDLKKDAEVLRRAYNDREGVTAKFNLNLLARLNREIGTDFDIDRFRHEAVYNEADGRVEMHLVSRCRQVVRVDDTEIPFEKGETIWTESSYKYTLEEFAGLARRAGLEVRRTWTDDDRLFSVQYLMVDEEPAP